MKFSVIYVKFYLEIFNFFFQLIFSDWKVWLQDLVKEPAPIEYTVKPLSNLINSHLLAENDETSLKKAREALDAESEKYCKDLKCAAPVTDKLPKQVIFLNYKLFSYFFS